MTLVWRIKRVEERMEGGEMGLGRGIG